MPERDDVRWLPSVGEGTPAASKVRRPGVRLVEGPPGSGKADPAADDVRSIMAAAAAAAMSPTLEDETDADERWLLAWPLSSPNRPSSSLGSFRLPEEETKRGRRSREVWGDSRPGETRSDTEEDERERRRQETAGSSGGGWAGCRWCSEGDMPAASAADATSTPFAAR
jgi:hypothetical protein